METLYCYAYSEDEPSCEVLSKLVAFQNNSTLTNTTLELLPGFPENKRGCQNIKIRMDAIWKMAEDSKLCTLVLTDLDEWECAPRMRVDWLPKLSGQDSCPNRLWFRIAVREIESWIMADRDAFAGHLGISAVNFSETPDALEDPKQYLLNVIRAKCNKKKHREMLPTRNAHVGPEYNPVITDFIRKQWDPERASANSPSLQRALGSLVNLR